MTDEPTPEDVQAARGAVGWREAGIPRRETHAHEPPRYPHRSRWRLTPHQGDDCVWIRVRLKKAPPPPDWLTPLGHANSEAAP